MIHREFRSITANNFFFVTIICLPYLCWRHLDYVTVRTLFFWQSLSMIRSNFDNSGGYMRYARLAKFQSHKFDSHVTYSFRWLVEESCGVSKVGSYGIYSCRPVYKCSGGKWLMMPAVGWWPGTPPLL
jgi:hypothetical protein